MAKEIEPKLVKIRDYLKLDDDVKFVIPQYQRKYSWEIANCDKLWSDINDFMNSDREDPYFFGTVIISCSDDYASNNDDASYNLIDGQQRTVTFLLLLKALLLKVNEKLKKMVEDDDSEKLKNSLKQRRWELISILYNRNPEDVDESPDEDEDKEIYNGFDKIVNKSNQETYKDELNIILRSGDYNEIEYRVKRIKNKQKDNKYTNYFRNFKHFYFKTEIDEISYLNKFTKTLLDCQIIRIKSWKVDQAIEMFNSLNSDGMPLNDSDIIYSKMFAEADKDKEILGDKWKYLVELTNDLESKKITTLTAILNQKMYAYRFVNKDIINDKGNVDLTTPGLRKYYIDINQELLKRPIELCNELLILAEMWNFLKDRTLIKILLAFNDNSKLYLASYLNRYNSLFIEREDGLGFTISDSDKNKLIKEVENITIPLLKLLVILSLVDTGYSSANFKSFLFREGIKLVDNEISNDEISEDFSKHINDKWEKQNILKLLKVYQRHDIVYLNEYLFAKENGLELDLRGDIDIEHIMPQSGKNIDLIKKDAQMDDENMFRDYVNKIGNKLLLEYNINRSIGNEWFRSKISNKISDKSGYINSRFHIAKSLVKKYQDDEKAYWTKEDIDNATKEASERIVEFIFD